MKDMEKLAQAFRMAANSCVPMTMTMTAAAFGQLQYQGQLSGFNVDPQRDMNVDPQRDMQEKIIYAVMCAIARAFEEAAKEGA